MFSLPPDRSFIGVPLSFTPFLVFLTDKTIKLWKISERDKRPEGYNLKEEDGRYKHPNTITSLRVSLNCLPGLTPRLLMSQTSQPAVCGITFLVTQLPFSDLYSSAYFQPPVKVSGFSFLLVQTLTIRGVRRVTEMKTLMVA